MPKASARCRRLPFAPRTDYDTPEQIEAWVGGREPKHYAWAMREGGETMWVAETAGQIVGFSSLRGDEVVAVYTSPRAPPGTGARLLEAVEAEAHRRKLE